jgi:hypothetical protein
MDQRPGKRLAVAPPLRYIGLEIDGIGLEIDGIRIPANPTLLRNEIVLFKVYGCCDLVHVSLEFRLRFRETSLRQTRRLI